jgi:hypothetical protein
MDRVAARAELRRLVMAASDIEAARDLCSLLRERGGIDGHDWGSVAWGLWTGVVCSYARPLKRATLELKAERWRTFDDNDRQLLHDRLIKLRDTLFAHNDKTDHRSVVVFPPGSWGPDGSATEEQSVFNVADIDPVSSLCQYQLDRVKPEIRKLVSELCAGRSFGSGAIVNLSDIVENG